MATVLLDLATFRAMYPQFAALSDARVAQAFAVACLLCDNSDASPVPFEPGVNTEREVLLYLLTCHLCDLALRPGTVVGTMTSAAEGTVNTAFSLPTERNMSWYAQTQCGLTYWTATAKYRKGRYYGQRCH